MQGPAAFPRQRNISQARGRFAFDQYGSGSLSNTVLVETSGIPQVGSNPKARILVIEDNVAFVELLRIHLSSAGYAPGIAADAIEGGKALLARTPDLDLCDVYMPFMNGIELLALMRTDRQTDSIPVILLSSHSDDRTVGKAMELSAADFLTKPVKLEDLLKSIHTGLPKFGRKVTVDSVST